MGFGLVGPARNTSPALSIPTKKVPVAVRTSNQISTNLFGGCLGPCHLTFHCRGSIVLSVPWPFHSSVQPKVRSITGPFINPKLTRV